MNTSDAKVRKENSVWCRRVAIGLRGPQPRGLVLGRRELIQGCWANVSPDAGNGRPMKVGKEHLIGVLAALKRSLAQDEPAVFARYEASARTWWDSLTGLCGSHG